MKLRTRKPTNNRDGALLPMLAVVIIILFVAATMGVDIARMHLTRAELRTATDASARAAVEAMGRTQNKQAGIDAAINIANRNNVAGLPLTVTEDDIDVGTAAEDENGKFSFLSGGSILTSVRVNGHRTVDSPDGPVGLLFGPMFGVTDFSPDFTSTATRSDRDIALVLDVSGSMSKEGRFQALAEGLDTFLSVLESTPQDEHVSLSVYETTARKLQPITSDLDLVRNAFQREVADGNTAIGLGLGEGLDSILHDSNARSFALKSIVLMTDGNHNTGINPEEIAKQCADAGVTVVTITFKGGANKGRMQTIADSTGGQHFHANNGNELKDAFETIARQLAVMLIE